MGETYSRSLIDENKSGDSIIMLIDKKEFNRKILKIEKIPFPENYLHAEKISIREIHNKKFEYLSLKNYEKANRFNNYLAVGFFGLFGLLMLYIGTKGIIYHNSLN